MLTRHKATVQTEASRWHIGTTKLMNDLAEHDAKVQAFRDRAVILSIHTPDSECEEDLAANERHLLVRIMQESPKESAEWQMAAGRLERILTR